MILTKVEIDSFGKLHDFTLEFSKGINLISGENEAGKSTLCAFLYAMFYGMPNESKKLGIRDDSRKRYRPWDDSVMSGTIYFSDDGKDYILSRRFGKTNRSDKISLKDGNTWEEVTTIAPEELGYKFLGVGADAFLKTMFITQAAVVDSVSKDDEILKRLSNLKQSGDEEISYQNVASALEKAKFEIVSKSEKAGILPRLQQKQEELEHELIQVNQLSEQFKKDLLAQTALQEELQKLEIQGAKLASQKQLARKHAAYIAVQQEQQKISLLIGRKKELISKIEASKKNIDQLLNEEKELEALRSFSQDKLLQLAQDERQLEELELTLQQLSDKKEILSALKSEQQSTQKKKRLGINIPMAIIALTVVAAGVIFGFTASPILFFLLPVGLLLAVISCVGYPEQRNIKTALKECEQKISDIQNEINSFHEQDKRDACSALKRQLEDAFLQTDVKTVQELSQKAARYQQILSETEVAKKEQSLLLEALSQADEDLKKQSLPQKEQEFEEAIKNYTGDSEEKTDLLIAENYEQQMQNRSQRDGVMHRLQFAFAGTRSADIILSELDDVKNKIAEYQHFYDALCLTEQSMQSSYQQLKQDFAPLLNNCVGKILSALTDDKYNEIRLADDYKIMLRDKESGNIVSAEYLSAGTYDILYLALRFGIVSTILPQQKPMLILDDAFLQLDDKRAQLAAAYLSKEYAEGQVLYFTCHKSQTKLFQTNNNQIVI